MIELFPFTSASSGLSEEINPSLKSNFATNGAATRLYFLSDAGLTDVTDAQPQLAKLLAEGLSISAPLAPSPFLDTSTLEALRSLGYVR